MILVAVRDAPRRETIRAALAHEGWLVSVVGSLDSAFRMAADHAPRLVVLDSGLPGSDDLVNVFARANGGPGILLVGEPAEGLRRKADAVVGADIGQRDLVGAVKRCLDAPRPEGRKERRDGSRRWTSEELFGEILEDLDAAVAAVESRHDPQSAAARPSALEAGTTAAGEGERAQPAVPTAPEVVERPVPLAGEGAPRPVPRTGAGAEGVATPAAEGAEGVATPAAQGAEGVGTPAAEGAEGVVAPGSGEGARPVAGAVAGASVGAEEEGLDWPPVEAPRVEAPSASGAGAPRTTAGAVPVAGQIDETDETGEPMAPPDALLPPIAEHREEPEVMVPPELATGPGVGPDLEPEAPAAAEPAVEVGSTGESAGGVFGLLGEERPAGRSSAALDALADALLGAARPAPPETGRTEEVGGEAEVQEESSATPSLLVETVGDESGAPPDEQPVEEVERRIGAYRLLERLAETSASELWRGMAEDGETEVVVRVVREDLAADERIAERFLAAGLAIGTLEHPSTLPLLEAGWVDGQLVAVSRYVEGVSLEQVLAGMRELGVRMPLGLALAVGERIAAALATAHAPAVGRSEGIVHGSLHPGNVLLSVDGDVRVADFALSRALARADDDVPVGRLRYRAPELVAGDAADRRSDLFSFGTLLYELVTGRPAYPGRDAAAVAGAILNEAAEEPERVDPTVPAEVGGLISRLLKRRRDERLQGASEAQRKLDLALQGLPSPPGRRELAAYLRQLRDAVALVRSVADDEPDETGESGGAGGAEPAMSGSQDVPVPGADEKLMAVDEGEPWDLRRYWWLAAILLLLALVAALAIVRGRGGEAASEPAPVLLPEPPPRPSAGADGAADEITEPPQELEAPPPPPVTPPRQEGSQTSRAEMEALVAEEFARRQRAMEELLEPDGAAGDAESTGEEPPVDEPPADEPPR